MLFFSQKGVIKPSLGISEYILIDVSVVKIGLFILSLSKDILLQTQTLSMGGFECVLQSAQDHFV